MSEETPQTQETAVAETPLPVKDDRPLGLYVSQTAPSYKLRLKKLGIRVQFQNGTLSTNAFPEEMRAAIVAELDELIAKTPAIAQIVRKVDITEAERFARAQKQKLFALGGGNAAIKGAMTSSVASMLAQTTLRERDAKLRAQGVDPATINVGEAGELMLTHATDPNKPAETLDLTPKSAEQKAAFSALLAKK